MNWTDFVNSSELLELDSRLPLFVVESAAALSVFDLLSSGVAALNLQEFLAVEEAVHLKLLNYLLANCDQKQTDCSKPLDHFEFDSATLVAQSPRT